MNQIMCYLKLILTLSLFVARLLLTTNATQLNDQQKIKLKEIAVDFGFSSPIVSCLSSISRERIDCILQSDQKWSHISSKSLTEKFCCQKWEEFHCIAESALQKCDWTGFRAVQESQLMIRQLFEAEVCLQYEYGSLVCVDSNHQMSGDLSDRRISLNIIFLLFLLIFVIIFLKLC